MDANGRTLVVKFTEQQLQILDRVKQEGTFGKTYPEVVLNLFREYVKQTFGRAGA